MGLFSKKTVVCKMCGSEFQTRFPSLNEYCKECEEKRMDEWSKKEAEKKEIAERITGYVEYGKKYLKKSYSVEEMKEIAEKSEEIFEKIRKEVTVTRDKLREAKDNYKQLTDEQCAEVLINISNSLLESTIGAAYSSDFFVLTSYSKVVIPVEEVFAVGFMTNYKLEVGTDEAILCMVFTNNSYIPVFPMIFIGKTRFFEFTKSKKGRESVSNMFTAMCPNLTYPVTDIKEFKKAVKKEDSVRGNLEKEFILKCISDASYNEGIFNVKNMSSYIDQATTSLLEEHGYITEGTLSSYLGLDERKYAKFWEKKRKQLFGE